MNYSIFLVKEHVRLDVLEHLNPVAFAGDQGVPHGDLHLFESLGSVHWSYIPLIETQGNYIRL